MNIPLNSSHLNGHTLRFQQKIIKTVATLVMPEGLTLEVKMLTYIHVADKWIFEI